MNWIERCKLAIAMLSNGLKAVFRSDDLITALNHDWENSRRIPSAFRNLRRKSIFPFSHEWFAKVDQFLGPNDATHEIDS